MRAQLESVACPFCRGEQFCETFVAPDRFRLQEGAPWRIVTCANCRFVYLNPRPVRDSMAAYYRSAGYQPFVSTQRQRSFWDRIYEFFRKYTVKRRRRVIEKLKPKGAILDVGCGTGEFLHEMQRHGWQVAGLENDTQAAEFARSRYHLAVSAVDVEEFEGSARPFDVITFWHVLEHVYDPKTTLLAARRLLADGGWLLIAAPNIASFDAHVYRENWVALDAPRHLHHFYPDAMRALCTRVGLTVVEFRQLVLDAFFNCFMSEKLIFSRRSAATFFLPFGLLRAKAVALLSVIRASRLRAPQHRQGSSLVYFIQKKSDST